MYLYYFLSAFGPKMQPFLWWKRWGYNYCHHKSSHIISYFKFLVTAVMCRYLTRLQMVQFVCVFFHALLPLVLDCGYPKIVPLVHHFFLIKFISVFVFLNVLIFQLNFMRRRCVQMRLPSLFYLQTSTSLPMSRSIKMSKKKQ